MTPVNEPVKRTLLHTRSLTFRGYKRDDGLPDIEACMCDEGAYESYRGDIGIIPAGLPIREPHGRRQRMYSFA